MRESTVKLLQELENLTAGLLYHSGSEYPFKTFEWEVQEKGELTVDKLLQSEGFLKRVEIDEFFPQNRNFFNSNISEQMELEDQKQLELIDFLQSHCRSVEVYLAQKSDGPELEDEFEEFPLILAEIQTGVWVGIAPDAETDFETRWNSERLFTGIDPAIERMIWERINYRFLNNDETSTPIDCFVRFDLESLFRSCDTSFDSFLRSEPTIDFEELLRKAAYQREQIGKETVDFTKEIARYLVGVKLFTRQFYDAHQPVDRFVMRTAYSKESLITNLSEAIGFTSVSKFSKYSEEFESSYDYEYAHDGDLETLKERNSRLKILDRLLEQNLNNLHEYTVGCMSTFYLYDIGQDSDGNWVGVTTTAVWA